MIVRHRLKDRDALMAKAPRVSVLCSVALGLAATLCGCGPQDQPPPGELPDSVQLYINDRNYRRAIVERDLLSSENNYAQRRLLNYATTQPGWDDLPERDLASRPLRSSDVELLVAGLELELHSLSLIHI